MGCLRKFVIRLKIIFIVYVTAFAYCHVNLILSGSPYPSCFFGVIIADEASWNKKRLSGYCYIASPPGHFLNLTAVQIILFYVIGSGAYIYEISMIPVSVFKSERIRNCSDNVELS